MQIRKEQQADHTVIHHLTEIAFKHKAFSDGTEADIIDELRANGELTLSLVAIVDSAVVGHVAFSPVRIGHSPVGWYGLGPVAVHPDQQLKGIGTAIINQGLQMLREINADGCALIGDPKYYSRFGFVSDGNVHYGDIPDAQVQWLSFDDRTPKGELVYSSAFGG